MAKKITREYDVSEIKNGHFIYWTVCTQCWNACDVELKDEEKTYFSYHKEYKEDGSIFNLGQGFADCSGNALKLVITVYSAIGEIKQSIHSYNITNHNAATIGHGYNLCIEDEYDDDYNDIYIDIVGWQKKG